MRLIVNRLPWLAAACIVAGSGCDGMGQLMVSATFPFSIQAIPRDTYRIHLLVQRDDQIFSRAQLTPEQPSTLLRGLPKGPVQVLALAFDRQCRALASAQAAADIVPMAKSRAELTLAGLDNGIAQRFQNALPCLPQATTPSASPSAWSFPMPSASGTATPVPSGSPQVRGQVSVTNGNDLTTAPVGGP